MIKKPAVGSLGAGLLALIGLGDRKFREAALRAFEFLVREYGLTAPEFETDVYGAKLTYRGPIVAVRVTWDKQEDMVEVYVVRLRNGDLPLLVEEPQDWIYLSALLLIRAPHLVPVLVERTGRTLRNIDRVLAAGAAALREYGQDALAGDPAVFAEFYARYPQPRKRREWYLQGNKGAVRS